MKSIIYMCDKCGKPTYNPQIISVHFENKDLNYELELCRDCFVEFGKIHQDFTKSKNMLDKKDALSVAKHIVLNNSDKD